MELREFAERILRATTLEEKLLSPDRLSDESPGPALIAPEEPGRPPELRFKDRRVREDGPGVHRVESEADRARLLHFFANHELLAVELMALALLRFPEAPRAFRAGVARTLRDEQDHVRWYLARLRACGIAFGAQPVTGYIWRTVAPMAHPLDFVTGLSLTFEQANLDFARHFSAAFAEAGDHESAGLLERIHRDEIRHVAHGLKWLRRWKQPSESDWDAFCRQLRFPLSPRRARGLGWNVAARRAAGLDAQFIAELAVAAQSRGRTPAVFLFNPLAEGFVAQGAQFQPVKAQVRLARDLENLPQFLARPEDVVLVRRRPRVEFLETLRTAGFELPEFVELGDAPAEPLRTLAARKLAALRPWAWAPDSVALLAPLQDSVTDGARALRDPMGQGWSDLYSKAWSADFLGRLIDRFPRRPWLCTAAELGVAVHSESDALSAIAAIRARGHHRIVAKQALGLAGQNALRLWEPELLDAQRRWLAGACAQGPVVIEPWLEREHDFSLQLEITPTGLQRRGFTGLLNRRTGQFIANWAEPNHARRMPGAIAAAFGRDQQAIHEFFEWMTAELAAELRARRFAGPLGIDALTYRDAVGALRLKPIVEINPRHTMGRLTLDLMRQVCPGSHGTFRILNRAALRESGAPDFAGLVAQRIARHPLRLEGAPHTRIREGTLCLSDPMTAEVCVAMWEVRRGACHRVPKAEEPV
jgi:uncharacterized ferritin-like protein (DUF455 family)